MPIHPHASTLRAHLRPCAAVGVLALAVACGRIDFSSTGPADCSTAAPDEPCFDLQLGSATWEEARVACEALGETTHLARITSAGENAAAEALAATVPFDPGQTSTNQRQRVWLGGSNQATGDTWVWTDGEPFTYTNWRPGQPGTPDQEHCMIILGSQDGYWDNRPCDYRYEAYLCQRD